MLITAGNGMFIFHKESNIVECLNIFRKVQNRNIVMTLDEFNFDSSAALCLDQH